MERAIRKESNAKDHFGLFSRRARSSIQSELIAISRQGKDAANRTREETHAMSRRRKIKRGSYFVFQLSAVKDIDDSINEHRSSAEDRWTNREPAEERSKRACCSFNWSSPLCSRNRSKMSEKWWEKGESRWKG